MKHIVLTTLRLLIVGIAFIGCGAISDHEMWRSNFAAPTKKYTGPQTVEALMETFDERYTSHASNAKWAAGIETAHSEKRHIAFTLVDMDAKYPRKEWLQMLLNKGITIETFKAYDGYFNIRSALILKEFYTEDDWETVKAEYINTEIQKCQQKYQVKPETEEDWVVFGENRLPAIPGRIYLQKSESGHRIWHMTASEKKETVNGEVIVLNKSPVLSEEQQSNLVNDGVEPVGWEVVYLDAKGNPIPSDK
ncbi:MAG: hypothetical protein OXH00_22830 [Candidatus Poribacteria bacterium]|nr:hypothetical protein [Candidatus Poribacteria bacterium]